MRFRTVSVLLPVLVALCVATASARGAPTRGHLDRSFGNSGIATAVAPKAENGIESFTVGADGRVYVLYGSSLLAFQSDGKVAGEFGADGRIEVAPAGGEGAPVDLAVDSQGRLLVAGSIQGGSGTSTRPTRPMSSGSCRTAVATPASATAARSTPISTCPRRKRGPEDRACPRPRS